MRHTINTLFTLAIVMTIIVLLPDLAHATTSSGTSWDDPLENIRDAITGPIAYTITVVAIVVSGAMLAFGGEINEFARRMIMLVLVVALIMLAVQFLSDIWNTSGAVI